MTDLVISKRLAYVAGQIKQGDRVADIGTDHAYLPIYLLKSGKCDYVIAADVNKGPLDKAKKNAADVNIKEGIDFRLSDGLEKIEAGEVDTIVISGMGGCVIRNILQAALDRETIKVGTEFVLSPHSDREIFRKFLYQQGFKIKEEKIIQEKDWFYVIFTCIYDAIKREESPLIYRYGKQPMEEKGQVLLDYLKHEEKVLSGVYSKLAGINSKTVIKRREEVAKELSLCQEALLKFC